MRAAQIPEWVSVDPTKLVGNVIAQPTREQMPAEFNEQLVVEYYSR
jgi:ribosomal protein S4